MTSSRWAAVAAASLMSAIVMTMPTAESWAQPPDGDAASDNDRKKEKPNRGESRRGGEGRQDRNPEGKPQGATQFQKAPGRTFERPNGAQENKNVGRDRRDNPPERGRTFEKRPATNAPAEQPKPVQIPAENKPQQKPRTQTPPVNAEGPPPSANPTATQDARQKGRTKDGNRPGSEPQLDTTKTTGPERPRDAGKPDNAANRFNRSLDDRRGGVAKQAPNGQPSLWQRPGAKPLNADQSRKRFEDMRKARTEKVEGGRTVIREPDKRVIVRQNDRIVIQHDETERLRRVAPNARFERGKNGHTVSVVDRPGNVKIYSETDERGQLIRRYRRGPDGRDVMIIDNRRRDRRGGRGRDLAIGAGIGLGVVAGAAILNSLVDVPEPRVRIPRDRYIVDYETASDEDVYDALSAPPVEDFSEHYTLDEIRATSRLRNRMRRVDLDDITFEFGSWEVDPEEYRKLGRVARAMRRVIRRNPNEVFLIEGYTDAVGSEEDNLSLSDRRAESVAQVLTEEYQIPFENLTTQGYGEQYLKVETQRAERLNRRVAVRRITPLMSSLDGPQPLRRRADAPQQPPEDERFEHYETGPGVGPDDGDDSPDDRQSPDDRGLPD